MNIQLTDDTKERIAIIDRHIAPSLSLNSFEKLYIEAHNIIKYTLDNIEICDVTTHTIPSYSISNITLHLLKNCRKLPRTSPMKEIITEINREEITDKKLGDIINFNNEAIGEYITSIARHSDNSDIRDIIGEYGENIISRFIPIDVQTDIITNLKYKKVFKVKLDTNTVHFTIYSRNRYNPDNIHIVVIVIKTLFLIKLYKKSGINQDITLFFSCIEKVFPSSTNYLGPREINSGLTSFDFNGNRIFIYRGEEVEKLILHEMVHALQIDRDLINSVSRIDQNIKCNFNIDNTNKINFFECFTESIGLISNILVNSVLSGVEYKLLMANEIKWSILQCSKILKFYGVDDIDNFFCKSCCFHSNNKWIEKTAVLAYFFMKTAVLHNIDYFVESFMFNVDIDIEEFYKFTLESFSKIEFINPSDIQDKTQSLRMTLYDFGWNESDIHNILFK